MEDPKYDFDIDGIETPEYVDDAPLTRKKPKHEEKMELYDWVQCLVTAIVAGILIFVFLVRIMGVIGPSMLTTLVEGDKILVSDLFYTPQVGDIVVVEKESFGEEPIVKRVIAEAGQTVDIDFHNGIVYVDGVALDEPYTNTPTNLQEDFTEAQTVPEGCVFVMGDNRNSSTDSRCARIGMVDTRCIIGKVLMVLVPGDGYDGTRDWSRIGSVYR